MVESIIWEMDLDPCAEQIAEYLGVTSLFDLSWVLQNRCVAEVGVISHLRKCNETLTNKQDQYKDVIHTLNKEVIELNKKLNEETRRREKGQEVKTTLEKELTAPCS
nr:hypothetical protein CFP56_51613 [Quercus suber]